MSDPQNMTTVIKGEGNGIWLETTLPDGAKYIHDDGEALNWVRERHGDGFLIQEAQKRIPNRDDFTWP